MKIFEVLQTSNSLSFSSKWTKNSALRLAGGDKMSLRISLSILSLPSFTLSPSPPLQIEHAPLGVHTQNWEGFRCLSLARLTLECPSFGLPTCRTTRLRCVEVHCGPTHCKRGFGASFPEI